MHCSPGGQSSGVQACEEKGLPVCAGAVAVWQAAPVLAGLRTHSQLWQTSYAPQFASFEEPSMQTPSGVLLSGSHWQVALHV